MNVLRDVIPVGAVEGDSSTLTEGGSRFSKWVYVDAFASGSSTVFRDAPHGWLTLSQEEVDTTVFEIWASQLTHPIPQAPAWHDLPELEGMEFAVQRMKREIREVAPAASFSEPWAENIPSEDGEPTLTMVVLEALVPGDDDALGEMTRAIYGRMADVLRPDDLVRLTVIVSPQRSR